MNDGEIPPFVTRYSEIATPNLNAFRDHEHPRVRAITQEHAAQLIGAFGLSTLALEGRVTTQTDVAIRSSLPKGFTWYEDMWFEDVQVLRSVITKVGATGVQSIRIARYPLQPSTIERIISLQEADAALTQAILSR